ncbi:MAG: prepilin-type N-terminal cleavage/methylation domain-containing protein [Oscillospiraceae bacterium]|jgi:prepilin-type N-terminal cleavage/methylation domain-containing protein|nr:prepilin-type N-terminal cleavage/methylation domain-containing protein [Oscillospiraceae bacterium]
MKLQKHKKRSKSVKGMTLIEIIIAIFVLGVMGVIMCRVATVSGNLMKAANHTEKRTAVEAPLAAARTQEGHYEAEKKKADVEVKITGTFDEVTLKADKYTTKKKGDNEGDPAKTQNNADLVYYTNIHS